MIFMLEGQNRSEETYSAAIRCNFSGLRCTYTCTIHLPSVSQG